jgi:RNA polymerase sigma factor (TIGR02999 family)
MDELGRLLQRAHRGDKAAREQVFAVAYEELRALARAHLKNGGRNTLLDTTALVHESYLRFRRAGGLAGAERGRFFSYAARVMRSVIVDFARQRQTERRHGNSVHVPISSQLAEELRVSEDQIIKVSDALESLQQLDERLARVVEMRYFAGMTEGEIARALGVTDRTVRRDWEKAKLLLIASLR